MLKPQTLSYEQLEKENGQLRQEVTYLKEQLEWMKRQIFGEKSEKLKDLPTESQLKFEGFEDIESANQEQSSEIATHVRKRPNRDGKDALHIPDDLPVERVILDISEKQKKCPETGRELVKIGEEISRKLAHKPGSYYIKEIVRPKYAMPDNPDQGIITASLPESMIPRGKVDESFLADILVRKFADHLPLYRIEEGLARCGIGISRKLLSQWVVRIGQELKPLHNLLSKEALKTGNLFIDESPIKMLSPGRGKAHQGYMWVIVGGQSPPNTVAYHYRENRKHANAFDLLDGFSGNMHSDKYGAYTELAKRQEISWCPCMSHIRRKFFEAETGDKEFKEWILGCIKKLFLLEREAWNFSPQERLKIRLEKEEPILDEMITAVKEKLHNGSALPKSKFREALHYCYSLAPYLKNYCKDPFARLDNNVAERAIRPLTIGRKNWLFVGSPKAGESSAVILSLVQTCRNLKINPRTYLEDILRRFQSHHINELHALLPENWAKNQA